MCVGQLLFPVASGHYWVTPKNVLQIFSTGSIDFNSSGHVLHILKVVGAKGY